MMARRGVNLACGGRPGVGAFRVRGGWLPALALGVLCSPAVWASQSPGAGSEVGQSAVSQAAGGQQVPPSSPVERGDAPGSAGSQKEPAEATAPAKKGSAFGRFMRDVGGDYKHFFSRETAYWYAGGLGAAGLVHPLDDDIAEEMEEASPTTRALEGGDKYGNLSLQVPLAAGWWIVGHMAGSVRHADAGRDLVRAQISAASWAYAWKYAVDRTRPNGDPRSFPSGHAAATFATAMVLQDHFGWKVGVPFFAASTYTALSRLTINKHWASDVTFGAFVGIASARTVTLHLRNTKFVLVPVAVPRGGGIALVRAD